MKSLGVLRERGRRRAQATRPKAAARRVVCDRDASGANPRGLAEAGVETAVCFVLGSGRRSSHQPLSSSEQHGRHRPSS